MLPFWLSPNICQSPSCLQPVCLAPQNWNISACFWNWAPCCNWSSIWSQKKSRWYHWMKILSSYCKAGSICWIDDSSCHWVRKVCPTIGILVMQRYHTRSTDWFNCSGGKEAEDRIEREEKARSISFLWTSIGSAVWSRLGHCWGWSWLPGSSAAKLQDSKTLLTTKKDSSFFWNRSLDCLEDAWPILSSRVQLLLWTVSQLTRPRRTKDFWQARPLLQACFG